MTIIEKHFIQVKNGEYSANIESGVIVGNRGECSENTCEVWELPHTTEGLELLIKHCQEVLDIVKKGDK